MMSHAPRLYSYGWLNDALLYGYTAFCFPIHLLSEGPRFMFQKDSSGC